MRTRIALSVLVVSLVIAFGFAQSSLGEIRGIVTDDGGAAIAGVLVTATGPEQRSTTTDKNGAFAFQNLRPGSYDLQFQLAGFRISLAKVNVSTRVEQLKMTMSVAAASVQVFQEMLMRNTIRTGGGIASTGSPGGFYPSAESAPYLPGRYDPNFNTEAYDHLDENPFRRVANDPLSTFSIDVDTASYANMRRFLNQGTVPPAGAVRIEELTNYFRFDYP